MSERLLVIQDEETVADIIGINLRLEGFDVEIALNGASGLDAARTGDFDLIICDIMMPDINGYEICRQLKSNESTKQVPFLLLTTRTEVENKVAGLRAGADDFVTKPFDFEELLTRINMNLDRAAKKYSVDPRTGLPGNITADDALRQKVVSGDKFSLLLIGMNGLRPYREVYGDERFEAAIRFTSDMIKEVIQKQGKEEDLAAYLGTGMFSLLTVPERSETFARSIVRMFDGGIKKLYSVGDLERGAITTFDRRGGVVDNPIMTVSIGGASNAHRTILSHWEAAEIAKEVLDYAMTFPGSMYYFDRRKDGKKKSNERSEI